MNKLLSIAILSSALLIAVFGLHSLSSLQQLREEEQELRVNNRKLNSSIISLKNKLYAVQQDPHSLEKTVRTELGMAKQGEVIYVFPVEEPRPFAPRNTDDTNAGSADVAELH